MNWSLLNINTKNSVTKLWNFGEYTFSKQKLIFHLNKEIKFTKLQIRDYYNTNFKFFWLLGGAF